VIFVGRPTKITPIRGAGGVQHGRPSRHFGGALPDQRRPHGTVAHHGPSPTDPPLGTPPPAGHGDVTITTLAVGAAIAYFIVFGLGFIVRPELVGRFALRWTDPAGRTEVRCYYGGVSVALGGFLALLLAEDQADLALSGVLILASTVLLCRLVSTLVDGGRDHPYTRVAIPSEALMVLGLGAAKLLG
jgi:hypothetical protein